MDLNGIIERNVTVGGPPIALQQNDGSYQPAVVLIYSVSPMMDPSVHLQTEATSPIATMEAAINALLTEAEKQDTATATSPPEKQMDPQAEANTEKSQSREQNDKSRSQEDQKTAYSKWYRESKKAQLRQLEKENAFYKQQQQMLDDDIRRLEMCDKQLDAELQFLITAQGQGGTTVLKFS